MKHRLIKAAVIIFVFAIGFLLGGGSQHDGFPPPLGSIGTAQAKAGLDFRGNITGVIRIHNDSSGRTWMYVECADVIDDATRAEVPWNALTLYHIESGPGKFQIILFGQ